MNNKDCYIIAEIGSNHDGDYDRALQLINACAKAGASAVKFQMFKADTLVNNYDYSDGEQKRNNSFDFIKTLELPDNWLKGLSKCAKECGVDFLCTPFDLAAVDLLEDVDIKAYKIASCDINYIDLLVKIGKTGKKVYLSTGGSSLKEINYAVSILKQSGTNDICLLHCIALYPPDFSEMYLGNIAALQSEFGLETGLSDHSKGNEVILGAVALGAVVIEKHVTDDNNRKGPDHSYAMIIDDFEKMVVSVNNLIKALSKNESWLRAEREKEVMIGGRRGLYAAKLIKQGEIIKDTMIKVVRPAIIEDSVDLKDIDNVLGKKLNTSILEGEPIRKGLFK